MIDEKTLEEISKLRTDRGHLINAYEWFSDDNLNGYCSIPTDYEKDVKVSADAFLGFLLEQIAVVDKQLTSLGFQPSPLDLKEGEE